MLLVGFFAFSAFFAVKFSGRSDFEKDQQANQFRIYKREGEPGRPHEHTLVKTVPVSTRESDGSEVTSLVLSPKFPSGLFVAMSEGKVFHYYSWDDIAGSDLKRAPNGIAR